jgi:hypothetical protein
MNTKISNMMASHTPVIEPGMIHISVTQETTHEE